MPKTIRLNNTPSEYAYRLARKLIKKADDPQDLVDVTFMLTIAIHGLIFESQGAEFTKQFMNDWLEAVRLGVEQLVLGQGNEQPEQQ